MRLEIKQLHPNATVPTYAHPHDAGMDLYASSDCVVQAHDRQLVPTGIAIALEPGNVALVWDKSGIATKSGVTTLAGVIDAGYRGEIHVALYNTSSEPYGIKSGQKIAQLLIQPIVHGDIVVVENLSDTHRGSDGFGSTGL